VASSLRAAAVIVVLNGAIAKYGKPKTIIVDNGPEFKSKLLQSWVKDQQIRLHFIASGKPTQNVYIE
jgi:putative transposase